MKTNSAAEISARRIAALRAAGDDARNTVAWRDAMYEATMLRLNGR